jgi:uncharacterized protein YqgV (UPF0045/DUF77 family)
VVIDVITRSVQRRLTTATRVRIALEHRSRHPHRLLIAEVLTDVEQGAQSPLERRYLRDVERAHGLPRGIRNAAESSASRTRYRDVRYLRWSTVVELDGRVAHPDEAAFRDLRRDNDVVATGDAVLRYGWRDVAGRPCLVASQIGAVLPGRGWPGLVQLCGSGCDSALSCEKSAAGPQIPDTIPGDHPSLNHVRVVAEFTTEPFHGEGEPPDHAKRAWEVVQAAGLTGDFGPLGTEVQGDRDEVLDALREVITVALDAGATRITLQLHLEP